MKKRTIFIVAIITIGLITWGVLAHILSQKDIAFTLQPGEYTLHIRQKSGREVAKIDSTQTLTLKTGDYYYNISGEGYDGKSIPFTVDTDTEITIQPRYLESFVSTLEEREKPAIVSLLSQTYPSVGTIVVDSFTIDKTATWGSGKLHLGNNTNDIYRYILKRKDGAWEVLIRPTIAISKLEAKDAPEEILYSLY